jgi:glutaredoxin
VTAPLPDLVLYGRPGCHLCEDARTALDALLADRASRGLAAPAVREISIDDDPALHERYAFTIPVVALGGQEVELATSPAKLARLLTDVLDGNGAGH